MVVERRLETVWEVPDEPWRQVEPVLLEAVPLFCSGQYPGPMRSGVINAAMSFVATQPRMISRGHDIPTQVDPASAPLHPRCLFSSLS